jgi:hypothetical protein
MTGKSGVLPITHAAGECLPRLFLYQYLSKINEPAPWTVSKRNKRTTNYMLAGKD